MSEPLFVRLRNVAFSQSDGMIKCDTNCKWKSMTDKVDIASNRSTDISTMDSVKKLVSLGVLQSIY